MEEHRHNEKTKSIIFGKGLYQSFLALTQTYPFFHLVSTMTMTISLIVYGE